MRFQRFSAMLLAGCLAMQSPVQIYGAQVSDNKEAAETSAATVSLGDQTEDDSSFDMYYAEDAADMAAAVQTLDGDPSTRLTVRTEQSMEAEIPEGKGVYYDGTYILQFASEEEKDVASSALEDNGAKVSADTVLTICGDGASEEKNAEQTESTPAKIRRRNTSYRPNPRMRVTCKALEKKQRLSKARKKSLQKRTQKQMQKIRPKQACQKMQRRQQKK